MRSADDLRGTASFSEKSETRNQKQDGVLSVRGPSRDGAPSGENTSPSCRLRISIHQPDTVLTLCDRDEQSEGSPILPICTRCCFTMTNVMLFYNDSYDAVLQ